MNIFECQRCGYTTEYKCALIKHFQRKKLCHPVKSDIPVQELLQNLVHKDYKESAHACKFCGKLFNSQSNHSRHQKTCSERCKHNLVAEVDKMNSKIQLLETQLAELRCGNHHMQTQTITNNIQQNNIVNINLKEFGMESQGHLTTEFLNKCFADKGLVDLIEYLHFDKECPENHNVRLKSRKQELMEVYSNGKWMVKDQDQTLTELIQSGYRILRMHGRKNKDNIIEEEGIDEDDYEEITKWLETIYEDKKVQKPIKRDLIILFMNNQTMLLGRDREDI